MAPPARPARSRPSRAFRPSSRTAPARAARRRARRSSASPSSPQVMQCCEPHASPAEPGREPDAAASVTRSRWPSAPRAPARSRRPSAPADRGWLAPPPRRPSRSRSRRGSGPSLPGRRPAVVLGVEESDVDVAAYARDVDFGQPIQLIDDFDDLPRDRQAHIACSITRLGRIVKLCNPGYQRSRDPVRRTHPRGHRLRVVVGRSERDQRG